MTAPRFSDQPSRCLMFLPGDLFPRALCFWAMSLEVLSLQLIFPEPTGTSPGHQEAICFVLWQCLLPRADQPSSVERLQKLFPRVCTKSEMTPWSFLPSFPTSQEMFTLFLKNKKKDLKCCSKTICVWENPCLAKGGNSRDVATITAKPAYVCSPQNMKNGSKYN